MSTPLCPKLASYSPEMQRAAATSLERLPRDDPLAGMIVDYGRLRATLRVSCQGARS
jgi:hypothetical protein